MLDTSNLLLAHKTTLGISTSVVRDLVTWRERPQSHLVVSEIQLDAARHGGKSTLDHEVMSGWHKADISPHITCTNFH